MDTKLTVAELEALLKEARAAEYAAREAVRDLVQPVMQFTLTPSPARGWDQVWDDTCSYYYLKGKCLNEAELRTVGKTAFTGGMNYLFNSGTGRIATHCGGGSTFTSDPEAIAELSAFLVAHPEGA